MTVRDRLQHLTGEYSGKDGKQEKSRDQVMGDLRRRIETIMARRPDVSAGPVILSSRGAFALDDVVEGEEIATDMGYFYRKIRRLGGNHIHGFYTVDEARDIDMAAAALLAGDPAIAESSVDDIIFIDTETTGLAGGTGTVAFLVGLGWFEGRNFVTEQLFARDFSEERALLCRLLDQIERKKVIVSYNGKAFDVGLLATRFVMNRLPDELSAMPHLDLLHPCRRLLAHRLENARLATMESEILGVLREGDIPGSEIPRRYFDWLRSRDARLLKEVFHHNHLDVLSMAFLAVHVARIVRPNLATSGVEWRDVLAASRLLSDRDDIDGACRLLEGLILSCGDGNLAIEARKELSMIHKRRDRWSEAVVHWEIILNNRPGDLFAVVELAKWQEHQVRDYRRALDMVERAFSENPGMPEWIEAALRHRRDRLLHRLRLAKV
ncbi:MAG: ribonuclease H-like domain-containing protein [Deltaproteobacteria bacterium]|nr:ribonuclease H-like domain-containing protein [Deltaproteobacteria bacterium]